MLTRRAVGVCLTGGLTTRGIERRDSLPNAAGGGSVTSGGIPKAFPQRSPPTCKVFSHTVFRDLPATLFPTFPIPSFLHPCKNFAAVQPRVACLTRAFGL